MVILAGERGVHGTGRRLWAGSKEGGLRKPLGNPKLAPTCRQKEETQTNHGRNNIAMMMFLRVMFANTIQLGF
ncbi:hypothetical protein CEXT_537741 [Caerostris extrusa]|uniref:Uncharacterized protein n=1 Tax=Caerostris extrusa TaxID=172846 RepID=A0AAV4N9V0_CAEEX|nr:hypothetical protein CEXT_537741 [Caerostris extrusa]